MRLAVLLILLSVPAYAWQPVAHQHGTAYRLDGKKISGAAETGAQVADRAHAFCASVDLEFSQKFYDCMDKKMHGIYIDSSTVRSRN